MSNSVKIIDRELSKMIASELGSDLPACQRLFQTLNLESLN